MARKLTELTDAQRDRMAPYAAEWIDRTLHEPVDRAKVEWGITECYRLIGLAPPRVVWVSSPLVVALAGPIAAHLVDGTVRETVDGAVGGAVRETVGGTVYEAVRGAVDGAVHGAVHRAVDGTVYETVHENVRGVVTSAVDGPVYRAIDEPLHEVVHNAVGDAVDDAVDGAVDGAVHKGWHRYLGGRMWAGWDAWRGFLIDECHAPISEETHRKWEAWKAANGAGWWWPHHDFVIVSDHWTVLAREQVSPTGWGSHQLHCDTGPAIAWADGWAIHAWHGTVVPGWMVTDPTDHDFLRRVMAVENTEHRRCGMERYGWERAVVDLGLPLVCEEPDPANPPHTLRLYDLPADVNPYTAPVRLVVMTNASPGRDGRVRQYAETVPAEISTPMEAMAWRWDVPVEQYAALSRAT